MYTFSTQRLVDKFKKRGYTYRQFAALCGVTPTTIYDLFNTGRNPKIEHLLLICEILAVSPQSLFKKEQEPAPAEEV